MGWQEIQATRKYTQLFKVSVLVMALLICVVLYWWPQDYFARLVFDFLRLLLGSVFIGLFLWGLQRAWLCLFVLAGMAMFPLVFFWLGLWLVLYGDALRVRAVQ